MRIARRVRNGSADKESPGAALRELVRTNDTVLVSAIGALLTAADIHHLVFDQNMSVLEGSLGVLPRRVLVADDDLAAARRVLRDAGLVHELRADARAGAGLAVTQDAVLGGRLTLRQPKRGHRVGHDAILLAAAVDAKPGQHAVDFGAGVGSAGLALARRVEGVRVTLTEIDEALCELAADNIALNGFQERARVVHIDVTDPAGLAHEGLTPGSVDHVLMNPPFNDPHRQQSSPDALRRLAHMAPEDLLPRWVEAARDLLRPDGSLTLIWRAEEDEVLAALRDFSTVALLPIVPTPGKPPIRLIARAQHGVSALRRRCRPLVLNSEAGEPSPAAEAILRAAQPLLLVEEEA